ncbi:hypothetical protein Q3G72_013630 [Acer saccharum]|nr:hypothetical protein Q3G72_013630 [Acer saccharum]
MGRYSCDSSFYHTTDLEICRLGRLVLPRLVSGVSQADVGALLFLAFQLYTPGHHGRTNKLFEEPRFVTIDDVLYFSLSSDIYDTIAGTSDVVVPSEGISGELCSCMEPHSQWFSITDTFKATLYMFLYASNANDVGRDVKKFLYGRIFDLSFMAALQTKACPRYVYLFASILKNISSSNAENIHQIKQLEDVSEDNIIRCDKGAKMILSIIRGDRGVT